jgi:hypothetical protein
MLMTVGKILVGGMLVLFFGVGLGFASREIELAWWIAKLKAAALIGAWLILCFFVGHFVMTFE